MEEKVIATKQCKQCSMSFSITDKDESFYRKLAPSINGVPYPIPAPTLCPDCRQQRRTAWRNEMKLYHRTCDFTGKKMVSLYSPDKKFKVYHHKVWRSDQWDPMDYGKDYDFNKPFFQQFEELLHQVPQISTYNKRTENTEYGNNVIEDKDCYLLFATFANENCYYGSTIGYCKNCVDSLWLIQCQNCYECIKSQNCYECFHCINCENCFSSQYLKDCINVDSSSFCLGLRNKKYHILNEVYSKAEYKTIVDKLQNDKVFLQETQDAWEKLKLTNPVKANIAEQSENSSGDYLNNCNNCVHCFDTMMAEDCRYVYDGANIVDAMDQYMGGSEFGSKPAQLVYECENTMSTSHGYFCSCVALRSNDMFYCNGCDACKNCFGCVGIRHKEYCIFNKQYTKEEYEKLVPKIIEKMRSDGERGEFFPTTISPFCYNETQAQIYYPLTKEEALARGWKRHDEIDTKIPEGSQVVKASDLSDIQDATDDIVNAVIICEVTGKPFKIIKQELDFYRKYNLPLPTKCFDQRHLERVALKTPRKIYERTCAKCGVAIHTGYAPTRPEIVYCAKCYYKEVYG